MKKKNTFLYISHLPVPANGFALACPLSHSFFLYMIFLFGWVDRLWPDTVRTTSLMDWWSRLGFRITERKIRKSTKSFFFCLLLFFLFVPYIIYIFVFSQLGPETKFKPILCFYNEHCHREKQKWFHNDVRVIFSISSIRLIVRINSYLNATTDFDLFCTSCEESTNT